MNRASQQWLVGIGMLCLLILVSCTTQQVTTSTTPVAEGEPPRESTQVTPANGVTLLPPAPPPFETSDWRTDFSKRIVEWAEIRSGGPPKDGIPSVDAPIFESVDAARDWLTDRDPVILFQNSDDVRAYPLAILIWHEIVNDKVGGMPVVVTFCPLCNASIVFDATFEGQVHEFGTTGRLRNSDLVMYDRVTESWWQQFTGQALIGEYAGRQLDFLVSQVISFGDYAAEFPDGQVMARPGTNRSYGNNPYTGYDSTTGRPLLFDGELDARLPAIERVVGLEIDGDVMAYPFHTVAEVGAVNDEVGGTAIVVLHKKGTASALDQGTISKGRDVGSVAVFERQVDKQILTFSANDDGTFTDAETGTVWNILGEGIRGEQKGNQLGRLISFDHFWFAWSAFYPETRLFEGS